MLRLGVSLRDRSAPTPIRSEGCLRQNTIKKCRLSKRLCYTCIFLSQVMSDSTSKYKSRRGKTLPPGEKRVHSISSRVNKAELDKIDSRREAAGGMLRGEYCRCAALDKLPPTVPEINREAWRSLGKLGANFNQFQRAINSGILTDCTPELIAEVSEIRKLLVSVRAELLTAKLNSESQDN